MVGPDPVSTLRSLKFPTQGSARAGEAQVKGFTTRGTWWLPEDDTRRAPGELRLSSGEFSLVLEGTLLQAPASDSRMTFRSFFEPVSRPIVLGRTSAWERITLLDCEGQVPILPCEVKSTTWIPTAAVQGVHLEAADEVVFDIIQLQHEYLHEWAGGGGIEHTIASEEGLSRVHRVELAAERAALASFDVDGARLELISSPAFSASDIEATLAMDTVWRVETSAALTWREMFSRWVVPLRDLVSFAALKPADIDEVRVHVAAGDEHAWGTLVLRLLELDRARSSLRRLIAPEMLFTSAHLPNGLEEGITRWLTLRNLYTTVIAFLLGVDAAPFMFDDQKFLSLTQAAEILHVIRIGGTPLPRPEHRKRVEDAVSGITDPQVASWAREILVRSNWYTLRDRLGQLIEAVGSLAPELDGGDAGSFVGRIVDTRNYLTHRMERRGEVLDGERRYWHWQALAWLVRAHLLLELGYTLEQATSLVQQNLVFQQFRARFAEVEAAQATGG